MIRIPKIQEQVNVGCGIGFAVEAGIGESHVGLVWERNFVHVAAVCVEREVGLVVQADLTKKRLLPCALLHLVCDGACDWLIGSTLSPLR